MNDALVVIRVLAILACLVLAFVNIRFFLRCKDRRRGLYRLFVGLCGVYFAILYTVVLFGVSSYALRSGLMTSSGVLLLIMLNIADVIIDERCS